MSINSYMSMDVESPSVGEYYDLAENSKQGSSQRRNQQKVGFVLLALLLVSSIVALSWSSKSSSSGTSPHAPVSMKLTAVSQSHSQSQQQPQAKTQPKAKPDTDTVTDTQPQVKAAVTAGSFRDRPEVDGFTELFQSDFDQGTVRLTRGGKYKLMDNIMFEPNPSGVQMFGPGSFLPDFSQASQRMEYDPRNYVSGFFSAITIEAPDVYLDLNGKTIEQTPTFYLMQRVYAHITTASSPFIENVGPNDFGPLVAATNCTIKNGRLALSSHHGIHGNNANGCVMEDLEIVDWEVAGIAQNNVQDLTVRNVVIGPALAPPIDSTITNARFLLEFFRRFISEGEQHKEIQFQGREAVPAKVIFERLETSLNLLFDWFINGNSSARNDPNYNPEFEADGQQLGSAIYGIVINGVGPAVTGIGFSEPGSSNILLENVVVRGLATKTREVVAVVEQSSAEEFSIGPTGELVNVFEWSDFVEGSSQTIEDLKYIGNSRSDALFALNEYCLHLTNLSATPIRISDMIRNWAIDGKPIMNPKFVCNGDCQFHVNKGVFGIRIEGAANFELKNVEVDDIENRGDYGSNLCGDYTVSHPESAQTFGYGGTAAYGISITRSNGKISETTVSNVRSERGVANGIVVWDSSDVEFDGPPNTNLINTISALGDFIGVSVLGAMLPEPNPIERARLPNRFPEVCGLEVRTSTVTISGISSSLKSQCLTSRLICDSTLVKGNNPALPPLPPTVTQFGEIMPQCGMGMAPLAVPEAAAENK